MITTDTHITSLVPMDSHKSFYGKASAREYRTEHSSLIELRSYNSYNVARIRDGVLELLPDWNYSRTTRRHLTSFAITFGVYDQLETLIKAKQRKH